MKSKKLKKSLSIIFLSKIYLNSSIFIIKEEDNDSSLSLESYTFLKVLSKSFLSYKEEFFKFFKYPLHIRFFSSLNNLKIHLDENSNLVFLNLREFYFRTESPFLRNSIIFNSTYSHLEFFLSKNILYLGPFLKER